MGFSGASIILSSFPQMEGNDAGDLSESRSKTGLSALEKSSHGMTFAQVHRASIAAWKLDMGYAPGSCQEHRRKRREELLYLKFCFWA